MTGNNDFNLNSKGVEIFNKKITQFSPPNCEPDYEFKTPVGFGSTSFVPSINDIEPLNAIYIGNHHDRLLIALLFSVK